MLQVIQTTPKEDQKVVLKKLKEEQRRKMALLGEQYEQTIAEMLQKQSVCLLILLFSKNKLLCIAEKMYDKVTSSTWTCFSGTL